jgi:hypothetical protein
MRVSPLKNDSAPFVRGCDGINKTVKIPWSVASSPLLLFPCSLLALFWLFPQTGYGNDDTCDPWYLFGLIGNPAHTLDIPFARQISRVPAFLPANLLYRIAGGAFIERGFYLAFTLVPMCLVYLGVRRIWSTTLAAFVTVFVFFSSLHVSVGSITYTLPALSYGLSAIGLYLIGATIRNGLGACMVFMIAAAALGSALHAHAASIPVIFALPILAYYSRLFWIWGPIPFTLALLLSSVLGLLGATLGFGLLNYGIVGRGIEVFLPQISLIFREATDRITGDLTYPSWYQSGPVIGLIVLCMAGLVQHAIRFFRRDNRDLPGCVCLAAMIVSVCYLTFIQQRYYFMYDVYYVFLLMPTTLALASLLRGLCLHVAPAALYLALLVLMSVIIYVNVALDRAFYVWWNTNSWEVSLGLAIAILTIVVWFAFFDNQLASVRSLTLLSCLLLFFGLGHSHNKGGSAFFEGDRPSVRAGYDRVKLGINFIRDHYHGKFPNFWLAELSGAQDGEWLFKSFVRCRSELTYPLRLPDPEVHWQQPIAPGQADGLIVVSNEPTLSRAAQTTLAGAGVVPLVYQSKEISSAGIRYYILLLDLVELRSR